MASSERTSDRIAWTALLILIAALFALVLFGKLEGPSWVTSALPSANLVELGTSGIPQLGVQFSFDRFRKLHGPLTAYAPAPAFFALGVDRVGYLIGALLGALAFAQLVASAMRRAFGYRSMAVALLLGLVFVAHPSFVSSLRSQSYEFVAIAATLLLFLPAPGQRPSAARWLLCGALPLFHPTLIPAAIAWLTWSLARILVVRENRVTRAFIEAAAVLPGALLTAWWYAGALGEKNWWTANVLGLVSGRDDSTLSKLRLLKHGLKNHELLFAVVPPSIAVGWLAHAFFFALAVTCVVRVVQPSRRNRVLAFAPAAILLVLASLLALVSGFDGYRLYFLGLAPAILHFYKPPRRSAWAVAAVGFFAFLQFAGLTLPFLDRGSIPKRAEATAGRSDSIRFILENTSPGDRIVLGPPFVLAAATPELPENRRIVRVVPAPLAFGFDDQEHLSELVSVANIYLGDPQYSPPSQVARRKVFADRAVVAAPLSEQQMAE